MKFRILCFIAATLLPWIASAQLAIHPPNPKVQTTVRLQIAQGAIFGDKKDSFVPGFSVSMVANKITLTLQTGGPSTTNFPAPSPAFDLPIGQFPAGSYQVELKVNFGSGQGDPGGLQTIGAVNFSVADRNALEPIWNLTDMWYEPTESGWGISIIQHGTGKIFAAWFAYDADGSPGWYVMPDGEWAPEVRGTLFRGPLYRTNGPPFSCYYLEPCPTGIAFDSSKVNVAQVGMAYIGHSLTSYNNLSLLIRFNDGREFVRQLVRQSF